MSQPLSAEEREQLRSDVDGIPGYRARVLRLLDERADLAARCESGKFIAAERDALAKELRETADARDALQHLVDRLRNRPLAKERDALAADLEQAQSDLKSACLDRDRLAEKLRGYLAASVLQDERVAELTATVEQLRKDREQLNQVRSAHDADVRREAASKRSPNPGEQFCQRCARERAGICDYCGGAIPHASDAQFAECAAKANKAARGSSR